MQVQAYMFLVCKMNDTISDIEQYVIVQKGRKSCLDNEGGDVSNDEHDPDKEQIEEEDAPNERYFSVSLRKLLILNACSFGGYVCYWFYRNWKLENEHSTITVPPFGRAVLPFLFVHDLFSRISAQGKAQGIEQNWNYNHVGTIFSLLFAAEIYLIGRVLYIEGFEFIVLVRWVLIFLTVLPVIPIQRLCHQINNDPHGERNSTFTPANFIWIVLGSGTWLLNGVGVWLSFMSS